MKSATSDTRAVKAVFFDAVGTVLSPKPAVSLAYHAAGRRCGSQLSARQISERFRAALHRQEDLDAREHGYGTDEAREAARWREIVSDVFTDLDDTSRVFALLWKHFANPKKWRLYDDVGTTWRDIESRGLMLGLASNFDLRLHNVCAAHEPLSSCQWIMVSSQIGYRKPHARFFHAIAERLEVEKHELLVVGDDLENDFLGAQHAGLQALHLVRDAPRAHERSISTLRDVLEYL